MRVYTVFTIDSSELVVEVPFENSPRRQRRFCHEGPVVVSRKASVLIATKSNNLNTGAGLHAHEGWGGLTGDGGPII